MLKIQNLVKDYEGFRLDCSLEVLPGRVTGLVGQNGAGKSTVFKAALGLISINGGNIKVFGQDSGKLGTKDKQKLGVVLADSGFSEWLAAGDSAAILEGMYDEFDKKEFLGLCRRFGLPLKKKIKDFSTGMKAKLKVITAITHGASFLILDEPTAGLDVVARDELLGLLREFMERDEERSILISSHISSDLEGLCDDLYMIQGGRIVLHEDTDVLLGEYAVLKVDDRQYQALDRRYITRVKKETYGYSCLTNQKQFYLDNYPGMAVEKGNIDELIMMMIKGEA